MSAFRRLALFAGVAIAPLACAGPRPDGGSTDTASGRTYLVQLRTTDDQATAEQARSAALQWWSGAAPGLPSPVTTDADPVYIAWRAPLYRVRLGPFASRAQADSVLAAAREAFPDAFVAPSRRSSSSTP